MEGITLTDVITATCGEWVGSDDPSLITPTGASNSTHTLKPGEIFFALIGERTDGHRFLDAAFQNGAVAAVVSRQWLKEQTQYPEPLIAVDAPDLALGDLGRYYRKRFNIPVIGITGSNGKTTTKDMVAAVLNTRYNVLATEGNLNTRLGVPLTLFRLSAHHEVAVVEMGISEHGGLRYLCEMAQPNIGIITNIGPTHLEFLGSVEGVAKAKGELLEYLDESSMTILNLDDLLLTKERAKVKGRLLGFGIEQICQFRGERLNLDQERCGHFLLQGQSFKLSIPGRHNIYNALAAAAAGSILDVPLSDAAHALAHFKPSRLRSQIIEHNGIRLINDAYNANPASMQAALNVLAHIDISPEGHRIAVVGDMLEMGEAADAAHEDLGCEAAASNIDALFALGDHAQQVVDRARSAGLANAHAFTDHEALAKTLKQQLQSGDLLLLKGSRGLAMEQIALALGFDIS